MLLDNVLEFFGDVFIYMLAFEERLALFFGFDPLFDLFNFNTVHETSLVANVLIFINLLIIIVFIFVSFTLFANLVAKLMYRFYLGR